MSFFDSTICDIKNCERLAVSVTKSRNLDCFYLCKQHREAVKDEPTIQEYKIIEHHRPDGLEDEVQASLNDGFRLYGGVKVVNEAYFLQTVVK